MSTPADRMSVQTFANDLGALIRRYLLTFDPAAPTDLQSIRLNVIGANLGLDYAEQGGQPPSLHISMSRLDRVSDLPTIDYDNAVGPPAEHDPRRDDAEQKRGWLR